MNTRRRNTRASGSRLFNGPRTGKPRVSGTGYGSSLKARKTLKKIRGRSRALQRQIITTMYYRAKYHKYQTRGMRNAMKVYKPYLGGDYLGGASTTQSEVDSWLLRSRPARVDLLELRSTPLPADGLN